VHFTIEDEVKVATQGDVLYVPQNVPHGFKVSEHSPARILMMFCPAFDREKYFEALEELSADGRPPDQDALLLLMNRFDQYPLD
jgi:ribosomal protein L16 Arg81 hydroxylase